MAKPTEETRNTLESIITEIGAGKSFSSDQLSQIHNAACDRAISIVRSYKRGEGLFQMTANAKARGEAAK